MKMVRIESPKPGDAGCVLSQGTQVYAGDETIDGITSIDVHYRVDSIITATVELHAWQNDTTAEATFVMTHPKTGKTAPIKRIEFEDGSEFLA